jgi:Cu(I)/Ag(I) efflux system membrane fusion protein
LIDPIINSNSGVALAYVTIDNRGNTLSPESFFTARVRVSKSDREYLKIPSSALLWSGKRSIVYKQDDRGYRVTEVELHSKSGNYYYITGISEGDMIVSKALFSIDAAAQLNGGYSMMNRPLDNRSEDLPEYKSFVTLEFEKQISSLFENYLTLKDSYVATDSLLAKTALILFEKVIDESIEVPTTMDSEDRWLDIKRELKELVELSLKKSSFKDKRLLFKSISETIYKTIKIFGYGGNVYHQYCPMAFDDTGAYWLSDSDKILNPYFGDMMLRCGEVREEL